MDVHHGHVTRMDHGRMMIANFCLIISRFISSHPSQRVGGIFSIGSRGERNVGVNVSEASVPNSARAGVVA